MARTTDARGNRYIGISYTTLDPSQAYAKTIRTDQTLDLYGNITQSKSYDFAGAVRATYNYTYLTGSAYAQKFIFNKATKFVRVEVGPARDKQAPPSRFAVVLTNGRRIETEAGFDEYELTRLIRLFGLVRDQLGGDPLSGHWIT